jgi:hypothetical protein
MYYKFYTFVLKFLKSPINRGLNQLIVNQREENINKKFVLSSERHKFASMKKQNLNRQQTNAPGLFKKNSIEQYYPHIKKEESQNFNKEWREKKQIK